MFFSFKNSICYVTSSVWAMFLTIEAEKMTVFDIEFQIVMYY